MKPGWGKRLFTLLTVVGIIAGATVTGALVAKESVSGGLAAFFLSCVVAPGAAIGLDAIIDWVKTGSSR